MYKLKQLPEDFIVKEISNLKFDNSGKYSYYKLTKRGYTTQRAIEAISRIFRIRRKYINFAGNKDKDALTEQFISISLGPKKNLEIKDLKLEYLGNGTERLNLGTHEKNEFEITTRNISEKPKIPKQFPNYFDDQRFGINKNNHLVGKFILEGNFKEACALLPETEPYLKKFPNDFIGALNTIPKRIVWLFCHAYQSYLWNVEADKYLRTFKHKLIDTSIGALAVPEKKVRNKKIKLQSFSKIPQIPGLELGPESRDLFMKVSNLSMSELEYDELNKGMKKIKISFTLDKGSYATMLIKCLFLI